MASRRKAILPTIHWQYSGIISLYIGNTFLDFTPSLIAYYRIYITCNQSVMHYNNIIYTP